MYKCPWVGVYGAITFQQNRLCHPWVRCKLLESTGVLYSSKEKYPPIVQNRSGSEHAFLTYREKGLVCFKDDKERLHKPKSLNLRKRGKNPGCCHFLCGPLWPLSCRAKVTVLGLAIRGCFAISRGSIHFPSNAWVFSLLF